MSISGKEPDKKPNVGDKDKALQTSVDTVETVAEKPITPDEDKKAKAELGTDVAEELAGSKEDEIPKTSEMGKLYYSVKEEVENNPELKGPIANGLMAFLAMAAKFESKFGGLFDSLFGSDFFDSVKGDANFSDNDKKNIFDSWFNSSAEIEDKKVDELKKLKIEEASTKYVSSLLGVEELDSAKSLIERLKNMENADKKCFSQVKKLEELKNIEKIQKGTVIFFLGSLPKGDISVAYATGNGAEFTYFDIKTGPKTFDLKGDDSPVKSAVQFKGAFLPDYETAEPEIKPEEKPAGDETAVDKTSKTSNVPGTKTEEGKTQ